MTDSQALNLFRSDLEEHEYHIDALSSIIRHESAEPKADTDLITTLNFALAAMKQQRTNIKHIIRMIE